MRFTTTAGVLFTIDAFFFIDYFGCAPPIPPPVVGELDLFSVLEFILSSSPLACSQVAFDWQ